MLKTVFYFFLYGFAALGIAFAALYTYIWIVRYPYDWSIDVAVILFITAFIGGVLFDRKIARIGH